LQYLQHGTLEAHLEELQRDPDSLDAMAAEPTTPTGHQQQPPPQQQQQQQQVLQENSTQAAGDSHYVTPTETLQQQAAGSAAVRLPGRPLGHGLGSNPDVLAARADWLLHLGLHEEAYQLTSSILVQDPYAMQVSCWEGSWWEGSCNSLYILIPATCCSDRALCHWAGIRLSSMPSPTVQLLLLCLQALTTHLAAALQLGKKNELFLRLVNLFLTGGALSLPADERPCAAPAHLAADRPNYIIVQDSQS
jgi:hypothetical protein